MTAREQSDRRRQRAEERIAELEAKPGLCIHDEAEVDRLRHFVKVSTRQWNCVQAPEPTTAKVDRLLAMIDAVLGDAA